VASEVCRPRITSTRAIIGTGLKKCMPMTWAGRLVVAASLVMEMEEVLEAMMASGLASSSSCLKILVFSSKFSVAASMIRSTPFRAATSVAVWILARAAAFCSAVIFSFLIRRSRLPEMVATPFCTAASEMSVRMTSKPETAKAWAMPLPMVPAPTIPIVFSSMYVPLQALWVISIP